MASDYPSSCWRNNSCPLSVAGWGCEGPAGQPVQPLLVGATWLPVQTQEYWPPGYMLLQARLGPNRMSCNWTQALSLAPLWEPGTELSLPRAAEGAGSCQCPRRLLLPLEGGHTADPLSGEGPAASRPTSSSGPEGLHDPGAADVWEPGGECGGVTREAAWVSCVPPSPVPQSCRSHHGTPGPVPSRHPRGPGGPPGGP